MKKKGQKGREGKEGGGIGGEEEEEEDKVITCEDLNPQITIMYFILDMISFPMN